MTRNIDHAENIIYEAITGDGFSAPELRTRCAARALSAAGLLAPTCRGRHTARAWAWRAPTTR